MHRTRRLAIFTASNVDWRREMRTIDGRTPTRLELTGLADATPEEWVTDPRIAGTAQLSDAFFTRDGSAFDKGHLVRRDDVCWGASFEEMQKSNGDTYHVTNCSPQRASFNRASQGGDNWGDLENLVRSETRSEKAIVFSGPVLADLDRTFAGRDAAGEVLVQIPSQYWKIIVVNTGGTPQVFGFVLEQDLSDVALEMTVPVAWRKHLRPVADIEGLLNGLATLPWLRRHDSSGHDAALRIAAELT